MRKLLEAKMSQTRKLQILLFFNTKGDFILMKIYVVNGENSKAFFNGCAYKSV